MTDIQALVTENLAVWTSALQTKSGNGRGNGKKLNLSGIKKLRELILELAVRGKLVPQDENDEPASVLLDKIAVEKERLIKEKKIKKPKKLPEIGEDEKPFDLPKGWEWVRLGKLFNSIISGGTPSKRNSSYWNGNIPWASVKDLGIEKYISTTEDYITESGLKNGSKLAEKGDVLICTRMGLGKIAITTTPIAFNQDLKAVKLTSSLDVEFFLNSYATIKIKGTGTTVAGIKQEQLLGYIIGFPPLEEQHRIVAKVDELMALCDHLEQQTEDSITAHKTLVETLLATLTNSKNAEDLTQNWNRISDHFDTLFTTEESIDQLKQTILQLAVMGKLVPQDPNDESASVLLEKIATEKARLIKEKKIKKQKALPPFGEDEKPFDLPEGWEWCRGDYIADFIDPQPSHRTPPVFEGGVPYIGYTNIDHEKGINFKSARKISPKVFKEHNERYKLKIGDFVFGKIGTLGKPFFLTKPFDYCLSANLILIQPNLDAIHPEFLSLYYESPQFLKVLDRKKTNSTHGVFGIKKARLLTLPYPPFFEQQRIVKKVNYLKKICNQLKERIAENQKNQLQLADALTEQAIA